WRAQAGIRPGAQEALSFLAPVPADAIVQKHREKAALRFDLDNVVDAYRISLATLASGWGNHLQIRILDDRRMHIIGMRGRHVVDILVEFHDGHGVAGVGHMVPWDAAPELAAAVERFLRPRGA
ncbi:MAG: hypothetical protein J0H73_08590, partial [Salana multivorans]|nr:hypothetical protein [Salana multivorans]